jgi:hypothetical protein
VVGNERDTTRRVRFRGIRHYEGLFDQSLDFDRAVSRYLRAKGWQVQCLSILRPLGELAIEKLLAERYPRLLAWQVSCHAARLAGGRALPCGACEMPPRWPCQRRGTAGAFANTGATARLLRQLAEKASRPGWSRMTRSCSRCWGRGLLETKGRARSGRAATAAGASSAGGAERRLWPCAWTAAAGRGHPAGVRGRLLGIYRAAEEPMKRPIRPLLPILALLAASAAAVVSAGAAPDPVRRLGRSTGGAPVRASVGQATCWPGVLSSGTVAARAVLNSWRARTANTRTTTGHGDRGCRGRYRFTSHPRINMPAGPASTARERWGTLVTQHYPKAGRREAFFDLVLRPR